MRKWLHLLRISGRARESLDSIITLAPAPGAALHLRVRWFLNLVQWIRAESLLANDFDFDSGSPQAARVRYLLQVLDRQAEWKLKVSELLRSLIKDTSALNLFVYAGIPQEDSFARELNHRIFKKILPQAPQDNDLSAVFSQHFSSPRDVQWFRSLDQKTLDKIFELFSYQDSTDSSWNSLLKEAEDAILLLAIQIRGIAMSQGIRDRIPDKHFTELPLYKMTDLAEKLIEEKDHENLLALSFQIDIKVEECFVSLSQVYDYLEEYGISNHLVYQMDRIERQLRRIRELVALVIRHSSDTRQVSTFIVNLVAANSRRQSVQALLGDNLSLLARKIVERTAETGEHYISRNREQFRNLFRSAMGGGIVTTLTTIFKFLIYHAGFTNFFGGLVSTLNYSSSFLLIHFSHFTLGTKQPAATAPVLAARMHKIQDPKELENLVEEVLHIVRSQVTSVLGNIVGVVPVTLLVCLGIEWAFGTPLLNDEKAQQIVDDFSILGPTPLYAAFTGILLFSSSLFAGWADNWFAYHRLSTALSHHRRFIFVFGELRARTWSLWLKKNVSPLASNISLGFLLGMVPVILQFLSIPLDVRHVTLSSGSLAAAMATLPSTVMSTWGFWLAIVGIGSMGVLNISVSFVLALWVAIRARRVQAPEQRILFRAIFQRIKAQPKILFFPAKRAEPPEAGPGR